MILGCRPDGDEGFQSAEPEGSITPSSTATIAVGATIQVETQPPPEPTLTAPATVEPTQAFPHDLDCREIFCQEIWQGILARPIGEGGNQTIDHVYPYASTYNRTMDPHYGVEFPNRYGTPVLASQAGEVVYAGTDDLTLLAVYTSFYGNVVIVKHPNLFLNQDLFTLYAHLSEIHVEVGETVTLGQEIGKVGLSGAALGAHLHFEVRLGENAYAATTNPVLWFSPLDDPQIGQTGSLAGIILDQYGDPLTEFELTLQKLNAEGVVERTYYPKTYYPVGVNPHPILGENFTLPDLPPGDYRLMFIAGGLYEVTFTLEPGALGFIKLQAD